MTPRPEIDTRPESTVPGLSTFSTLEQAVPVGGKGQSIDLAKLTAPLVAFIEEDGHVAIAPANAAGEIDHELLEEWAATRDAVLRKEQEPHPLSIIVMDAVTGKVARPR